MTNTHETIAGIIAWLRKPREGENGYLTAWRDEIADRLEAAHKRELARVDAVIDEAVHGYPPEDINDRREIGDAAKLREALVCLRDAAREFRHQILNSKYNGILDKYTCEKQGFSAALKVVGAIVKANYAIVAPARNCDRPECATTKAAQDVWRKEDGGKTAYYEWLLATTTEKEGGNDADK